MPIAKALLTTFAISLFGVQVAAKDSGDKRDVIDKVIIHTIGGPIADCPNGVLEFSGAGNDAAFWKEWFEKQPVVGIHFIIDQSGTQVESISTDEVANHAIGHNQSSIGIELVHRGNGKDEFPDAMMSALNSLLTELAVRHDLKRNQFMAHSAVDDRNFDCGGNTYKVKMDPGENFPWDAALSGID